MARSAARLGRAAVLLLAASLVWHVEVTRADTACDVDLGFIIDGSGSITKKVFNTQVKGFLTSVANSFLVQGNSRSQIGAVTFSFTADLNWKIGQYSNNAQIEQAIKDLPYPDRITNTPAGLDLARTEVFLPAQLTRPDFPKIAVLITDGAPNLPEPIGSGKKADQLTREAADRLKAAGVTLISVGVGIANQGDLNLLTELASDPSLFLKVTNFDQLQAILATLLNKICIPRCPSVPENFGPNIIAGSPDGCVPLQNLAPNQACSVTCAPGYVSNRGTTTYQCTATGQLKPPTLACIPKGCKLPPFGPNVVGATTDSGCKGTTLQSGKTCTVQCASGFVPDNGSTEFKCTEGDLTTTPTLQCKPATCTIRRPIPFNSVGCTEGTVLQSGDSCQLTCAPGFVGVGNGQYKCNLGVLSKPDMNYCVPAPCPIPAPRGIQNNGNCPASLPGTGATCTVGCNAGFTLQGSGTYKCTNGQLIRPTGTCVPNGCTVPKFPDIAISTECKPGDILNGNKGTCTLTCPAGYTASGPNQFVCNLGVLESNPTADGFQCLPNGCIVALPPGVVGAGNNPCPSTRNVILADGQSCTIGCPLGSTPQGGLTTVTCDKGQGTPTGDLLTCQQGTCTYPTLSGFFLEPGTTNPCNANGGTLTAPNSCTMKCTSETINATDPDITVTCTASGLTTSRPTNCVPRPCSITPPANTEGNCPVNNQLSGKGGSCTVRCKSGYIQTGGTVDLFTCNAGNLDSTADIVCEPAPCAIPTPDTGFTLGTCSKTLPGDGSSCSLACASGFTGTGSTQYTCNAGELTVTNPNPLKCTPDSCTLPNSVLTNTIGCGSQLAGNGASCTLQCAPGFATDGTVTQFTITCRAGKLINLPPNTFQCKRLCSAYTCGTGLYKNPTAVSNGLTCINGACDRTCCLPTTRCDLFKCPPGLRNLFVPPSGRIPTCTDRPTCLSTCCGPQLDPAAFQCPLPNSLGFKLIGLNNTCSPNGALNPGQSCEVTCAAGWRPIGGTTLFTCGANGQLTTTPSLTCKQSIPSCLPLDPFFFGGTTPLDTTPCASKRQPGDACTTTFVCPDGFVADITTIFQCRQPSPFERPRFVAVTPPPRCVPSIARPCNTLRPPVLSCPSGTVVNNTAVCPGNVANCNARCCIVPPPLRPCSTISPIQLNCPAGTIINGAASCPGTAQSCTSSCCTPAGVPCSAVTCASGYQKVPSATTCNLLPRTLCSMQQCCVRRCTALWGAVPVSDYSPVFYAVKIGANGLPYCFSYNGRQCASFSSADQIAALPAQTPYTVSCSHQSCKSKGNWCATALSFCA